MITGCRPPLLKGCPAEIENLMTTCWSKSVENRPSMRTVVETMRQICSVFPDTIEPLVYKYADNVCNSTNTIPIVLIQILFISFIQYDRSSYAGDLNRSSNELSAEPQTPESRLWNTMFPHSTGRIESFTNQSNTYDIRKTPGHLLRSDVNSHNKRLYGTFDKCVALAPLSIEITDGWDEPAKENCKQLKKYSNQLIITKM